MFFPWANSAGAISGGIAGVALVSWMSIGSQLAIHNKQIIFPKKPVLTHGCENSTLADYSQFMNTTGLSDYQK